MSTAQKGRTHGCTDQACKREESTCQLGAVHTWHITDERASPACPSWANAGSLPPLWARTAEHRNASVLPPKLRPKPRAPRLSARLSLKLRRSLPSGMRAKPVVERCGSTRLSVRTPRRGSPGCHSPARPAVSLARLICARSTGIPARRFRASPNAPYGGAAVVRRLPERLITNANCLHDST
jgi:hypothetical protein